MRVRFLQGVGGNTMIHHTSLDSSFWHGQSRALVDGRHRLKRRHRAVTEGEEVLLCCGLEVMRSRDTRLILKSRMGTAGVTCARSLDEIKSGMHTSSNHSTFYVFHTPFTSVKTRIMTHNFPNPLFSICYVGCASLVYAPGCVVL